jgi:hypothetical protein
MGEAKKRREAEAKRREKMTDFEKFSHDLEQSLIREGKYVRAGWVGLQKLLWPNGDVSPMQLREMEKAFMAGAQHMFTGIINALSDDKEPTAEDYRRMELMDKELQEFGLTLLADMKPEGGVQ